MSKTINIKKGATIKLQGEAQRIMANIEMPATCALKPADFHNLTPKMVVKVGDEVKAGSIVFIDKYNDKVKYASPVSGEIAEIVRGAKRKILEIKIMADKETKFKKTEVTDIQAMKREQVLEMVLNTGLFPVFKQRPFDVVANPMDLPKAIFISAFDTNPLAADNDFIVHGQGDVFQKGIDVICKLTTGKVHLNVNSKSTSSKVFTNTKGVQINHISGPHPAGNVGIQIHHIAPINKGEVVWTLTPQDVIMIGKLFTEGIYDASKIIALVGSSVNKPKYFKTIRGASITSLFFEGLNTENKRFISGNVLTGTQIDKEGYLGFYDSQITVIPEGGNNQFFGWLPFSGLSKLSLSKTSLSWLMPNKQYNLNTNTNGEERALVMSGEYEKVFPMDIYPVYLLKAMIAEDIDAMESLGIYEVAPEDFSLCEYACTSKLETQKIVRKALDLVQKETS